MPLKQSTFDFDEPEKPSVKEQLPVQNESTETITETENPESAAEVIDIDIPFVKEQAAPVYTTTPSGKKTTRGRMKFSDMNAAVERVEVPADEILFEKRYYSIGSVSAMFKVNPSLIRFWENEFDILKPKKNGKGDRFFRPEDVKSLQLIHHLLRERKYTMEGAKEFLKKNKKADEKFAAIEALKKLKGFLLELKTNL